MYNAKQNIWFYEFERLCLFLTLLNVVSLFLIIRGSTAPLILDNNMLHFLFYSPETSDKTLYNIAISYFAAYVFYLVQVYYPERKKTKRALTSIELPASNLINQTNMFLFVWETFTKRNTPDDGTILGVNISKIYYKNKYGIVMSADKKELGAIAERIRSGYDKIVSDMSFQYADNALRQLVLEKNIPAKINKLYQVLLSAEILAQDSSTTILDNYSKDDVDDIRIRLKKLNALLKLECDFNYAITTDENEIKKRDTVDAMGNKIVLENYDYFSRLSDSYKDMLRK